MKSDATCEELINEDINERGTSFTYTKLSQKYNDILGNSPLHGDFILFTCPRCSKNILAQGFKAHIDTCQVPRKPETTQPEVVKNIQKNGIVPYKEIIKKTGQGPGVNGVVNGHRLGPYKPYDTGPVIVCLPTNSKSDFFNNEIRTNCTKPSGSHGLSANQNSVNNNQTNDSTFFSPDNWTSPTRSFVFNHQRTSSIPEISNGLGVSPPSCSGEYATSEYQTSVKTDEETSSSPGGESFDEKGFPESKKRLASPSSDSPEYKRICLSRGGSESCGLDVSTSHDSPQSEVSGEFDNLGYQEEVGFKCSEDAPICDLSPGSRDSDASPRKVSPLHDCLQSEASFEFDNLDSQSTDAMVTNETSLPDLVSGGSKTSAIVESSGQSVKKGKDLGSGLGLSDQSVALNVCERENSSDVESRKRPASPSSDTPSKRIRQDGADDKIPLIGGKGKSFPEFIVKRKECDKRTNRIMLNSSTHAILNEN